MVDAASHRAGRRFPTNDRTNLRRRHLSHVDRTTPSGRPPKSSDDVRLHLLDSRRIGARRRALRPRARADSDLISPAIPTCATPGHSLGTGITQWACVDRAWGPNPRAPYQPWKPSATGRPPGRVDGQHHRSTTRVPPVHHNRSHLRRVRSLRPLLLRWDDPADRPTERFNACYEKSAEETPSKGWPRSTRGSHPGVNLVHAASLATHAGLVACVR